MRQETSSSNSRRQGVVIAAKGFLVGASAVSALFVLEDLVSKEDSTASLRGGSNTPSTIDSTLPSNSSNVEHGNPPEISVQLLAASDESTLLPTQSYVPSSAPSTPIPTYMPTASGEIPTDMPTQVDNDVISSSLAKFR